MSKLILMSLVLLGIAALQSGCERNDYQHPLHRNK